MAKPNDAIVMLDAVELSAAIRQRKVSCREVMSAYLRHINELNPKVNAIISLQDEDELLRQADQCDEELYQGQYRGPLHGFPQAVKDLAFTKGIRTTLGPVADGSDMMGSLRNPAAFNNIFGFRPSMGRVPLGPAPDIFSQQFAYEGPMARTVEDLALLLSVQAGYDERAPLSLQCDPSVFAPPLDSNIKGKRIAWLGDLDGYLPVESGILELCQTALQQCEGIGCIPLFGRHSLAKSN